MKNEIDRSYRHLLFSQKPIGRKDYAGLTPVG